MLTCWCAAGGGHRLLLSRSGLKPCSAVCCGLSCLSSGHLRLEVCAQRHVTNVVAFEPNPSRGYNAAAGLAPAGSRQHYSKYW